MYKLLAFAVLTPILAFIWRCLLAVAGRGVLSDVDIAMFFFGPFGWFCSIALGAIWLAIVAVEQASLLYILAAGTMGSKVRASGAQRFAAGHAARVLAVTIRLIGWSLLTLVPFLLFAMGVYFWLLDDYDISYYLNERPTEFKLAIAVGIGLVLVLCGVLLRLYSGWFLSLPLVLFDRIPPGDALLASRQMVAGNRKRVLVWLVAWSIAVLLANVILTSLVGWLGWLLIPDSLGSLVLLATRVGLMLLVLAAAGLTLNLITTIGFAGILFHGYQQIHPHSESAIESAMSLQKTVESGGKLLTGPRLAAGLVIAALVAALIGYASLSSLRLEDDAEIMAHRGASLFSPENTLAAFRLAIEGGADWIEIDVQETADGEVVVLHDSDFMKLSGNPLKIWDTKLEDLAPIDIGSWFDPEFSEERVPTLTEVLQLCKGKVGVNIELKYYGHAQQLEQRVIDIVEAEGMVDQVMVMSLKPEGVSKVKALRPNWKCGLLLSVYVGDLNKVDADFLAVNSRFASRSFVKRAHDAGKQVYVWTVNDAATMSLVLNRSVDGILTDDPQLARRVLQQRAEMSTAERLLSEVAVLFHGAPQSVEQ